MCGIVGYIGSQGATGIILEGLKRLEYRGYDSAGVAILADGVLQVRRSAGRIRNLEGILRDRPLDGPLGLGHTRWATHGRPSEENAHPHTDCSGSIVVVHNGILENYLPIKARLVAEGHLFKSETDTEVVAHLVEHHWPAAGSLAEAVRRALGEVRGAYAVGVVSDREPDALVAANHLCPVLSAGGDSAAIDAATRRVRDERWPEIVTVQQFQEQQGSVFFNDHWGMRLLFGLLPFLMRTGILQWVQRKEKRLMADGVVPVRLVV